MLKKIIEYIKYPPRILIYLDNKNIIRLKDETFLKILFKVNLKQKLNLKNPNTFNEKIQWLKLNDRNAEYTKMVDKYEVKNYVANIIGEEYLIPTLGVWDEFDKIDFNKLPNQFVLKCTHDSGGIVICKDKEKMDINEAREKLSKSLQNNYYYSWREWPYKNVKPRIIAEKYMENKNGSGLVDYKFYCFSGKCDYVMLCTERDTGNTKFYYFDRQWNIQKEMSNDGKALGNNNLNITKPTNLDTMFEIVEKLSLGIKFVRIDLYNIDEKIYFGEYTFYPSGGFDNERTDETMNYLNEKLKL